MRALPAAGALSMPFSKARPRMICTYSSISSDFLGSLSVVLECTPKVRHENKETRPWAIARQHYRHWAASSPCEEEAAARDLFCVSAQGAVHRRTPIRGPCKSL